MAGQLGGSLSKLFLQPHIHCLGKQPVHKGCLSTLTPPRPSTQTSTTPSFTSPKEGFPSPSRDGKESPRLQEVLKAERLSPIGGGGKQLFKSEFSRWRCVQSFSHMLGPYGSYMTTSQDYSSAALYSTRRDPGMSPSYSPPKLRNQMRLSPPGM